MDGKLVRALALLVTLAFAAMVPARALEATGPKIGEPAPAFDLPTVDGKRVTLAGLRGKTVVVNAWATWCPPCRLETPDLVAAYKQIGGKDVVFVGVDSTESAALVKAFVASKGASWTQAVDDQHAFVRDYDVRYFPSTWVIDPQGILRTIYVDVISPKLLAGFVEDAKAGRNGRIASTQQIAIDALLDPSKYVLTGDETTIVAGVEKIRKAIDVADKLVDESDPGEGKPIDLPRTQAEEEALRAAAIAALRPIATNPERKLTLNLLAGDSNWYKGDNQAALAAYREASALDPKNADALGGIADSARRLHDYDTALAADEATIALDPTDVTAVVQLGIDCGTAGQFARGRAAFDRAIAMQEKKANAPGAKPVERRLLAWAHMYYGRMEVKAKDDDAARRQFALAAQAARRLPKTDSRYAMYLEQAQEETVALDLGGLHAATGLSLAPWTGPELPGSVPNTIKYRLVVAGPGGASVALRAEDLPKGWIASFCTDRLCAPLRVTTLLPAAGVKVIEFQVVPPTTGALAHAPVVRVVATDGKTTASIKTN